MQTFREFFGKKKPVKKDPVENLKNWKKMKTSDEFYSALSDATADMNLGKTKALGKSLFGSKVKTVMAGAKTKADAIAAIKKQYRREIDILAN